MQTIFARLNKSENFVFLLFVLKVACLIEVDSPQLEPKNTLNLWTQRFDHNCLQFSALIQQHFISIQTDKTPTLSNAEDLRIVKDFQKLSFIDEAGDYISIIAHFVQP